MMRRHGLAALAALVFATACESSAPGQGAQLGGGDATGSSDASGDATALGDAAALGDDIPLVDSYTTDEGPVASDVQGRTDYYGPDAPLPDVFIGQDVASDAPEPSDAPWPSDTPSPWDVPPLEDAPWPTDAPWPADVPEPNDVPWQADIPDYGPMTDLPGPIDAPSNDTPSLDIGIGADVDPSSDVSSSSDVDPGVDAGGGPATAPTFRLTSLHIDLPVLCYGEPCLDVSDFGNQVLDDLFSDPTEPADVLLELGLGEQPVAARLGAGLCERTAQGQITGCSLDTSSPPDAFDLVVMGVGGSCLGLPGECMFTANTLGSLAFAFGDYLLGLSEADVGLQVDAEVQTVPAGALEGFLPVKIAQTLAFNTLAGVVSLDQLLSYLPTETVNGQAGWWVRMSFEAERVPTP